MAAFYLLSISFVLFVISICQGDDSCMAVKDMPCTCTYNDGIVSLELDAFAVLKIQAKDEEEKKTYNFYYSPCGSLKGARGVDQKNCGDDTALCQQEDLSTPRGYALGSTSTVYRGVPGKDLEFEYPAKRTEEIYRKSIVKMECDENSVNKKNVFSFVEQNKTGSDGGSQEYPIEYVFRLRGPVACASKASDNSHGWSAGSVLLLIFFVAVLLYLIIGVFVNKCMRGATGLEVLPHYAFWSDIPSLVKDGWTFTFTCGCCQSGGTARGYDNI